MTSAAKRTWGLVLVVLTLSNFVCAPTALAQSMVPVVDIRGGGCLMGGVRSGQWLEAKEAAPLMRGGERYSIYTLTAKIGTRSGDKPTPPDDSCTETYYVKNMYTGAEEKGLIGVGGDWNALPRVPKVESANSPVYRAAVAEVLRQHGIRRAQVRIQKVLRVDLEGDGTEEVLISATRAKKWPNVDSIANDSNAGDYSVVLLRKVFKGKVETIVIEGEYHPRAGRRDDEGPPNEYELTAVLDLNGDGRMEVIIEGGYYEGNWRTAYVINGRKAQSVIGCGCGA
jgi:hypothetical protein